MLYQIDREGWAEVPACADFDTSEHLLAALEAAHDNIGARRGSGGVYAMRNVLEIEVVRIFAQSEAVRRVLAPVLGESFFAVRGANRHSVDAKLGREF